MKEFYEELYGFGKTPAIAVIDLGLAWADKKGE